MPDPFYALPSLRGAPAYSRPPRPVSVAERPLDPDDLPLATLQTDEERRLADALLASRWSDAPAGFRMERELPGGGYPGYQAPRNGVPETTPELRPRLVSVRRLTDRLRTRG
jgi:hypothetical protein